MSAAAPQSARRSIGKKVKVSEGKGSSAVSLMGRLAQIEESAGDFWTFSGKDDRTGAHNLFQYPAMMVPQVQGTILDLLLEAHPEAVHVADPFVGSGTTLVESMYRGVQFTGIDINPLAGLISLVKAKPIQRTLLMEAYSRLMKRLAADVIGVDRQLFPNERKWFEPSVSVHLSRIVHSIQDEDDINIRRIFWVAVARCVRLVCNSRSSTYKLHQRPESEIAGRDNNLVTTIFASVLENIIEQLSIHNLKLKSSKVLCDGKYIRPIDILIEDARTVLAERSDLSFDIVMTSPPYGDNITTVPYGQYSYLPLMWIPLYDIHSLIDPALIRNTHSTDTASLGGGLAGALDRGQSACGRYSAYNAGLNLLEGNRNAQKRFAAFASDLAVSASALAARTAKGGLHAWTIGDRYMGGNKVPMGDLLSQILANHGIEPLHSATRRILAKKMAHRNALSNTMTSERIVIGRMVS